MQDQATAPLSLENPTVRFIAELIDDNPVGSATIAVALQSLANPQLHALLVAMLNHLTQQYLIDARAPHQTTDALIQRTAYYSAAAGQLETLLALAERQKTADVVQEVLGILEQRRQAHEQAAPDVETP